MPDHLAAAPARWRLTRADALRVREWEDAGVVYDAFSGDTHLLDPLSLELLDLLRQRPWTLTELSAELSDAMPETAGTASEWLSARLERLARLDLIVAEA